MVEGSGDPLVGDGALGQAFLYEDGLNPIADLDGLGNVVAFFVCATRPNVPDYLLKGGQVDRIPADQVGSPRLVVEVSTGIRSPACGPPPFPKHLTKEGVDR